MTIVYNMRGRDVDSASLTFMTWQVVDTPDYTGSSYTGPKDGSSPLADIIITSYYGSPSSGGGGDITISPTALSVDTNDWNPASLSSATTIRISSSTGISLSGIDASSITEPRKLLVNVGSFVITLNNQSASSSSGNRFKIPGDIDLQLLTGDSVLVYYDLTSSYWRVC